MFNSIRKSDGITLTSLAITIIVLLIIAGISINYGLSTLEEVSDEKTETELSLVQQAIVQQYTLLLTQNEDGKIATEITSDIELNDDTDRPSILIGTRIASINSITSYGFTQYINDYSDTSSMSYEDYYYYLDQEDLEEIGIEKSNSEESKDRSYIVNYSTGEVYDITNEEYYTSDDEIYLNGTNSKINETTYNFTDE